MKIVLLADLGTGLPVPTLGRTLTEKWPLVSPGEKCHLIEQISRARNASNRANNLAQKRKHMNVNDMLRV